MSRTDVGKSQAIILGTGWKMCTHSSLPSPTPPSPLPHWVKKKKWKLKNVKEKIVGPQDGKQKPDLLMRM